MKRTLLSICAAGLLLSGCGGGSGKSSATTLLGDGEGIGAGLATPTSPATVQTTAAPAATTPQPPPAAAATRCPYTDPVSEIEYGGRLRLTLSVSALCPSRAADIALTLKVTNISNAAIHYDQNQAQFFSLLAHPSGTGRLRWEDTMCDPPSRDRTAPAGTLAPGQTLTFGGQYPAPKSAGDREKCRRLEVGGYAANAVFLACDGAAYTDGYCDISKDAQFQAHPVLIDVRA
ncbi:MAG TPA: hypothetical protein VMZ22_06540 [Acidimicrobiales bacterium]|nr:hypothetical protein [Acidimicrobiales bacterium]